MVSNFFPHANFLCRWLNASFFKHWTELCRQAVSRLVNAGLYTERYKRSDLVIVPVINASYATGGGTGAKVGAALNRSLNNGLSLGGLR